jgi:hypothetical protein
MASERRILAMYKKILPFMIIFIILMCVYTQAQEETKLQPPLQDKTSLQPPSQVKKKRFLPPDFPTIPFDPRFPPDMVDPPYWTEEEEKSALDFAKQIAPKRYEKMMELKSKNSFKYWKMFTGLIKKYRFLERLKEKDPENYDRRIKEIKLEEKVHELIENFKKSTNDSEKKKIKDELKNILNEIFDIRQANREADVKRIEKDLKELKDNISQRKNNKDKIIDKHLQDILGEKDSLEW